jgi:hypothetical protein
MAKDETQPGDKLQTTQAGGALTRPSFIPTGSVEGTEVITKDDMQLPRLALAQAMSPQLKDTDPKFIADLRVGHLFNSLTGQNFGKGPVEFVILRADRPRYIEFVPRDEGGGIKDPNVPANDPRTQFGPAGEPPIATKFYDFIVLMLPFNESNPMDSVIGISFKGTQLKVARNLNGLIKMKNAPLYSCRYTVTSCDEKNALGEFKNFVVKQAGFIEDENLYHLVKGLYDTLKDKSVTIDMEHEAREPEGPVDTSFAPSEM